MTDFNLRILEIKRLLESRPDLVNTVLIMEARSEAFAKLHGAIDGIPFTTQTSACDIPEGKALISIKDIHRINAVLNELQGVKP